MNMAKLKEINKLAFVVPSLYGSPRKLSSSVENLPNWEELERNKKTFQLSWDRILTKIQDQMQLASRETYKAILYVDLIPGHLIPNLIILINKSDHRLDDLIKRLNSSFSNVVPISFLFRPSLSNVVNHNLFSMGIQKYSSVITDSGWHGLVSSVIEDSPKFDQLAAEFCPGKQIENLSQSFLALVKDILKADKKARMFDGNISKFARVLKYHEPLTEELVSKLDNYLGFFIASDDSWEGKVVSDDYSAVRLLFFFMNELKLSHVELPPNAMKIYEQRKNLDKAIDMLNAQEPDRGNFWREYMPFANRVVSKSSSGIVAVAFFFGSTVIVEFAPSGNAAYVYKREVFEKELLKASDLRRWKNKNITMPIRRFTREDGTLYHHKSWQHQFRRLIDNIIRKRNV
jgi:hypothetical protein